MSNTQDLDRQMMAELGGSFSLTQRLAFAALGLLAVFFPGLVFHSFFKMFLKSLRHPDTRDLICLYLTCIESEQ